jgi:zinc transport system permease protein
MLSLLQYPGAGEALLATLLLGSLLSILGIPLVLRGRSFTGIALAETAAFGAAIGSLLHTPKYAVPFVLVLMVLLLLELLRSRRTAEEGPVALIYLVAAASATLFVSKLPTGEADLLVLHFGNILSLLPGELIGGSILALCGGLVILATYRRLLAVVNDPISARAVGYRPTLILLVYAVLLAASVTYALSAFGVVLVFGYLVASPFVALRCSSTRRGWVLAATAISSAAGILGLTIAFSLDFPPGPFIAGLLGCIALFGWFIRR